MGVANKIQFIILVIALLAYCTQKTSAKSIGAIENKVAYENNVSVSRSNSEGTYSY